MIELPGYVIGACIYENQRHHIYRGTRIADGQGVVIKIPTQAYPQLAELTRFRAQYDIISQIHEHGIVRLLALERYEQRYALIMADTGGSSLRHFLHARLEGLGSSSQGVVQTLHIALQLADALCALYQHGIVHCDITPSNIIIQSETLAVELIDFNLAIYTGGADTALSPLFGGTLAYMPPEQSGRTQHVSDYRVDFYGLGVTLYQVLLNQLPFSSSDPVRALHSHLAREPISPSHIQTIIPTMVSQIILKLMAKDPNDRYLTPWGLRLDLQHCLHALETLGVVPVFKLAQYDLPDRLVFPAPPYGRRSVQQRLLHELRQLSSRPRHLLLATGKTGIGKSTLLKHLVPHLLQHHVQFAEGAYTPVLAESAAYGVVQAVQRLLEQHLSTAPEALETLATNIATTLGQEGKLLYGLLPQLATIMGEPIPVATHLTVAMYHQVERVLIKFMGVLLSQEMPLLLLLEDLHYAEAFDLRLVAALLTNLDTPVFIIATADPDMAARPLLSTLHSLCSDDVSLESIEIDDLSMSERIAFIGTTLHLSQTDRIILGKAIGEQIGGNPLHLRRALHMLVQQGAIWFDIHQVAWQFDLRAVHKLTTTTLVAESIKLAIERLDGITTYTLVVAACLGQYVSLSVIAAAIKREPAAVERSLRTLHHADLLRPVVHDDVLSPDMYQFAHSDIRDYVLGLLNPQQRQRIHSELGMALLDSPFAAASGHQYVLIEQLYLGGYEHLSIEQRELLATCVRDAMLHAQAYGAPTIHLARYGLELMALLGPAWYELRTLLLHIVLNTLLLEGDHSQLKAAVEAAMIWIVDTPTMLAVGAISMQSLMNTGDHDAVIATGRQLLLLLDVVIAEQPLAHEQSALRELVDQRIAQIGVTQLAHLPIMTDVSRLRQSEIIYLMLVATYHTGSDLFSYLILLNVFHSLVYGNAPESGYSYTSYGMMHSSEDESYETAYQMGRMGIEVSNATAPPLLRAQTLTTFGFCMVHLVRPLRDALPYLHDAHELATHAQHAEGIARSLTAEAFILIHVGDHLSAIEQQIGEWSSLIQRSYQLHMGSLIQLYHQVSVNLLQASDTPWLLNGDAHDESALETLFIEHHDLTNLCILYYFQLCLAIAFDQTARAAQIAPQLEKTIDAVSGLPIEPLALRMIALHKLRTLQSGQGESEQLAEIDKYQQRVERWAERVPANYQHHATLLAAERARVTGDIAAAMRHYEDASALAREHGSHWDEALIYECAGRCFLSIDQHRIARTYLTHAYYGFEHWGAQAKVHHMEQVYGHLLDTSLRRERRRASTNESSTSSSSIAILDIASIIRASQAMTQHMQLDQLLPILVEVMMEHAGAEHGVLLLNRETDWMIAAKGTQHQHTVALWPTVDADEQTLFPQSIVRYVSRTQQVVNLADARTDTLFGHDPYIRRNKLKSVFCIPFVKQQDVLAILYLENTLTTGAFTDGTRELLQILSGQAAIALQNALLYDRLARSNVDLKQARDRLRHQAYHDSLTGLLNRDRFVEILREAIEHPENRHVAVLFLDVDRFRIINDSYGHTVGDRMLQEVARRIQKRIGEGVEIARFGADEFMLLAHQHSTEEEAIILAETILGLFAQPFTFDTYKIYTNVSIGITLSTLGYDHAEDLMRDADVALNRAKNRGRGTYAFFDPSLQMALRDDHDLEHELRQVISTKDASFADLYLAYQPLIALTDNRLIGFEALLRWNHPVRGHVSPARFIRLAEETNMIVPIGWWSIHEACRQYDSWQLHDTELTINVNISPIHLQQPDFAERLVALVDTYRMPRSALKLEITESCTLDSSLVTADLLKQLRGLGFRLCIDDFGTGYSSLSRLHELPIDTVKIDRSFLKRIQEEKDGMEIVQMITSLAHALGMDVVAEGIETQAQLDMLRLTGCGYGQGYFLAHPLDPTDAKQFLLARQVSE